MADREIPRTLGEKYLQERAELYHLLWTLEDAIMSLASGNVASYSLGNRSVSYADIDKLKSLRDETEQRIDALEAKLSHRAPRCVTQHSFLDPNITLPRKLH